MLEEPPILTIHTGAPRPTPAQIEAFRGALTGNVCDAMAGGGGMHAAIAPVGGIRDPSVHVVGVALVADNGAAEVLATSAAATLAQPGDVIVAGVDGWQGCAACGDLFLGMMKNNGAAGFVTDGPMRDLQGVLEVGLPAWCTGLTPNSPYGKGPGSVGGAAVVGGVQVATGDLIVADCSGVVVVPFARIDEVIAALQAVKAAEASVDAKVRAGFGEALDIGAMLADGRAVEVG